MPAGTLVVTVRGEDKRSNELSKLVCFFSFPGGKAVTSDVPVAINEGEHIQLNVRLYYFHRY